MNEPVTLRLAATLMLARDGAEGLVLFTVVPHHEIEVVSGALVFPGGSAHGDDSDPLWCRLADGVEGVSGAILVLLAAAARARRSRNAPAVRPHSTGRAPGERRTGRSTGRDLPAVDREGDARLLRDDRNGGPGRGLRSTRAFRALGHAAHMPKRFDTRFFLAPTPLDH